MIGRALEKIKKSVCNRSEKGVCCPHPKKKEDARCGQGSGISCFKEDQCKYTQALQQKLKDGDTGAKQELIRLICDRKERTFCCPYGDENVDENVDEGVDIRKNKKKGPSIHHGYPEKVSVVCLKSLLQMCWVVWTQLQGCFHSPHFWATQ